MTPLNTLANTIFHDVTKTPADYEAQYPTRALPEGARVTRLAPSPTGYLHIGVLYSALCNRMASLTPRGVFFLRIEDTDKKREIEGGAENILAGLYDFGVSPDEGITLSDRNVMEIGDYGPYRQSERREIYRTFAKSLMEQGLAYPCFCSPEMLDATRKTQETAKIRTGYYGNYAPCRLWTAEQALEKVEAGIPFVVRLRSPGDESRRVAFHDGIRGTIELPENDQDIVLLKSDGMPTYHFAHAVDDHFMRTTDVIRAEEWISSTSIHLQLFEMLGWQPPRYAHIPQIMKNDGNGKRKISKRKDPEAAMTYYHAEGYPAAAVMEYLMTVADSGFEGWRRANPDTNLSAYPFALSHMSVSGALFDLQKLRDVSKSVIARMTAEEVYDAAAAWAAAYDSGLSRFFAQDPDYATAIFSIDRGGAKPRKDIAKWAEVKEFCAYFYDELYAPAFALPAHFTAADAVAVLRRYLTVYSPADERDAWFEKIKALCPDFGYAPDTKTYKTNPNGYKGGPGDVSTLIRLAVTSRANTPDLCEIMRLLGVGRVTARIENVIRELETSV